MSCLLEIPGGISTIRLLASLGSLGESHDISLGVSAVCLGRDVGCLRSAIFLGTACLGGRGADCLGISTHCLGRADCLRTNCLEGKGAGCLRSVVFPGTNCLGRADCLRTNCLGGRGTGCLRSTVFPGTNCLGDRGADYLEISALCLGRVRAECLRADCLGTICLRGRGAGCLSSALCLGATYLHVGQRC